MLPRNATGTPLARPSRNSHGREVWRRPDQTQCERLEVLHNGGEVELVASTATNLMLHGVDDPDIKRRRNDLFKSNGRRDIFRVAVVSWLSGQLLVGPHQ